MNKYRLIKIKSKKEHFIILLSTSRNFDEDSIIIYQEKAKAFGSKQEENGKGIRKLFKRALNSTKIQRTYKK